MFKKQALWNVLGQSLNTAVLLDTGVRSINVRGMTRLPIKAVLRATRASSNAAGKSSATAMTPTAIWPGSVQLLPYPQQTAPRLTLLPTSYATGFQYGFQSLAATMQYTNRKPALQTVRLRVPTQPIAQRQDLKTSPRTHAAQADASQTQHQQHVPERSQPVPIT